MSELLGYGTIGLLEALPDDLQEMLFSVGTPVRYEDGETIHHRGDSTPGLSVVREGQVMVGNYTIDGTYIATALLTRGHCFGEFTLFAGVPRTHHAQAKGPTIVDQITKAAFDRVLEQNQEFRQSLLAVVTTRLYSAMEFIEELRSLPLDVRMVKMLLRAIPLGDGSATLELTQDQLANALGVTRASINAALRKLQADGLVRREYGRIRIVNVQALTAWVAERTQIDPLPRPKLLRSLLAHARTTRMRIVTVTDHGFQPQAERFSDIVLPCHAASYGVLATHATMLSVLRLMAVAYMGQNPESVSQRIATLAAIDEELDLFD